MGITVTEASKNWNISRATIYNKINNGKLSKTSDGDIDPAEMSRVFGKPKSKKEKIDTVKSSQNKHSLTLEKMLLQQEIKHDKQRIEDLEIRLEKSERRTEEMERRAENKEKLLLKQIENLTDTMKLLQAPAQTQAVAEPVENIEETPKIEPQMTQKLTAENPMPKKKRFSIFKKIFD